MHRAAGVQRLAPNVRRKYWSHSGWWAARRPVWKVLGKRLCRYASCCASGVWSTAAGLPKSRSRLAEQGAVALQVRGAQHNGGRRVHAEEGVWAAELWRRRGREGLVRARGLHFQVVPEGRRVPTAHGLVLCAQEQYRRTTSKSSHCTLTRPTRLCPASFDYDGNTSEWWEQPELAEGAADALGAPLEPLAAGEAGRGARTGRWAAMASCGGGTWGWGSRWGAEATPLSAGACGTPAAAAPAGGGRAATRASFRCLSRSARARACAGGTGAAVLVGLG